MIQVGGVSGATSVIALFGPYFRVLAAPPEIQSLPLPDRYVPVMGSYSVQHQIGATFHCSSVFR